MLQQGPACPCCLLLQQCVEVKSCLSLHAGSFNRIICSCFPGAGGQECSLPARQQGGKQSAGAAMVEG